MLEFMAQGEEKRHQEGTGILQEMGLWGLTENQSMAMALSLAPMAGPCIQEMTDMAVLAPMANQEETQTANPIDQDNLSSDNTMEINCTNNSSEEMKKYEI